VLSLCKSIELIQFATKYRLRNDAIDAIKYKERNDAFDEWFGE
jgi:hypothetical protein